MGIVEACVNVDPIEYIEIFDFIIVDLARDVVSVSEEWYHLSVLYLVN